MTIDKCQELAALVSQHTAGSDGISPTVIDKLELIRQSSTSGTLFPMRCLAEPTLGIVVQGQKQVLLNESTYHYSAAQYLVISVDLPLLGIVVDATPDIPYLGFKLTLDPIQLCEIITQIRPAIDNRDSVEGWSIGDATPSLIDCAIRLTRLLDTPQNISFLAPMIIREIYYRLLIGKQGEAVRQIATSGSTMQRIAEVIKHIKANFAKQLRIKELAEAVNMSISSFHRHFKQVASMSPLQYQKQLRLLEARQQMLAEDIDATQAAYQVGYKSSSQFSREYSRMFGAPPIKDIEKLRISTT